MISKIIGLVLITPFLIYCAFCLCEKVKEAGFFVVFISTVSGIAIWAALISGLYFLCK